MADLEQEVPDEVAQEREELERQMRTSKALKAMERNLHLSPEVVMPVLLRLIKVRLRILQLLEIGGMLCFYCVLNLLSFGVGSCADV